MTRINHLSLITIMTVALCAAVISSCSSDPDKKMPADTLVKVGNSWLTRSELNKNIPGGLSIDDSVKYAQSYIRSWIDAQLITQVAAKEIDMTQIDRLVDQYRKDLIMWEYNRQMYDAHRNFDIPEDSLMCYYESHKDEFVLDRPLVKGLYMKVAEDAPSLKELRKLYRSTDQADIDKLEKSQLNGAVHYDYFRDNWIDWQQIESVIPYDYGNDADKFLRNNKYIDITQGGFTYLLDINDVLFSGQTMPFEAARQQIIDRLSFQDRRKYNADLRQQLYDDGIENGTIQLF